MRFQGSIHAHQGCQVGVVLAVKKVIEVVDLPQQGEAGGLLVKLRQLLLPVRESVHRGCGSQRQGTALMRQRGAGSRPAAFPNKCIEVHGAHFLHCKTGTIIPPGQG